MTCHIYAKVAKLCFETFLSTQTNLLFSYTKYSGSVNSEIIAFQFSRWSGRGHQRWASRSCLVFQKLTNISLSFRQAAKQLILTLQIYAFDHKTGNVITETICYSEREKVCTRRSYVYTISQQYQTVRCDFKGLSLQLKEKADLSFTHQHSILGN